MMGVTFHRIQHLQDKKKNKRHQRLQNLHKLIREDNLGSNNEFRVNVLGAFWGCWRFDGDLKYEIGINSCDVFVYVSLPPKE